jgi:hypothetical protein
VARGRTDAELGQALFGPPGDLGLLEAGNIDLRKQPRVKNPDGTTSTVRSMSINEDGIEILIPTVEHAGKGLLSDEDAIKQWHRTGKHLGKFKTPEAATAYAKQLHEAYARGEYDTPAKGSGR